MPESAGTNGDNGFGKRDICNPRVSNGRISNGGYAVGNRIAASFIEWYENQRFPGLVIDNTVYKLVVQAILWNLDVRQIFAMGKRILTQICNTLGQRKTG